jgi:tetratricopeptide (TPR) repeat protein
LATAYANLSALYVKSGKPDRADEAADLLDRSIELFRSLPYESAHFAAALNSKAAMLAAAGRYGEAMDRLRDAAGRTKIIFGENADYGVCCRNMARLSARTRDYAGAVRHMRLAADVFCRVFGEGHNAAKDALREAEEYARAASESGQTGAGPSAGEAE